MGGAAAELRKEALPRAATFFRTLNRIPDYLAGIGVGAVIVTVAIQILGRWVGRPAPWTEEATRFLFVWLVFLGIGSGFRQAESARVTVFLNYLPASLQRLVPWIYILSTVGFFVFMFITGAQLVSQQVRMRELGSALMIPMWLVGICVPVSALMGLLGVVESVVLRPELIGLRRARK
ncbi:ABC transporter permease [Gelria sp. Kuro-4]|nr:ABC transporter permease [Gelria sp. Kuro-4]